ncbi:hypothetical protein, partial [Haloferax sp. Atlit-24N]|uniref:hypothetical protein n=1 Tax=Haloferax sp. Atlit-24N TaxID=2077200 RepID=UPI001F28EEF8
TIDFDPVTVEFDFDIVTFDVDAAVASKFDIEVVSLDLNTVISDFDVEVGPVTRCGWRSYHRQNHAKN